MKTNDKLFIPIITALSIAIPVVVAVLMVIPKSNGAGSFDVSAFPLFHATLNGSTAFALLCGYVFIKRKQITQHRFCMLLSFVLSSIFLISYVTYHSMAPSAKYGGEGMLRYIYFFILLTHILLATTIVPLALFSIYRALTNQIEKHRKIAKWTFPIWFYVAVTGVLVYLMMKPYY